MEEIKAEKNGEVTQLRDLNENDLEYFMYSRISTIENHLEGLIKYSEIDLNIHDIEAGLKPLDIRTELFIAEALVNNFRNEMDKAFEAINNQVGVILLKQNPRYKEYAFKARLEKK